MVFGQQHHTTIHIRAASSSSLAASSSASPARGAASVSQPLSPTSPAFVPATPEEPRSSHTVVASSIPTPAADAVSSGARVLLATAVVNAVSPQGHEVRARALLDQGSELSFVCESLVQALHLPRRHSSIPLVGIGANKQTTTRGAVSLSFRHRQDSSIEYTIEAHVLPKLTGRIPSAPVQIREWNHLHNLDFADPSFAIPEFVDVLLGANIYGHLLAEDIRKGKSTEPVAQKTSLGWIVSGPVSDCDSGLPVSPQTFFCRLDHNLDELVQAFWNQETVAPPNSGIMTEGARSCEEHFKETHSRDDKRRYMVRLPFKSKPSGFGDSRNIALRMLKNLQRRFDREPSLRPLYASFLDEYLDLDHMELIEEEPTTQNAFYLPHHGVLRESSSTTKLRVVFNGSQKTNAGVSLNDTLHAGPKLQQDLTDVLTRWRTYPYVFSADIEKMYRQILVHPEDRRYQRILWTNDSSQPPTAFQLNTVTYGLSCAPFLAIRVLHQLANDYENQSPVAATVIRQSFYVDDLLSGDFSLELAQVKAKQVDDLLMAGGFPLQKWASNDLEVLNPIDPSRRLNLEKVFEDNSVLRALGLKWNPGSDHFIFAFQPDVINSRVATKRSVLSLISRLFDPLGWVAPIIITAKIFLQLLWSANLEWDEPLPSNVALQWFEFTQKLVEASEISIPRWIRTSENSVIELHGFSDASQSALAAVVYIRVLDDEFCARSSLLVAKTKVAPLKKVTIPRLELSAAVLLSQLVIRIQKCLDLNAVPVHLWTDSSVALASINGHPSRWKEFVANRVTLINELVPAAHWRHIAGADNPADVASRGMSPGQLTDCPVWWNGPDWLRLPSVSWPCCTPNLSDDVDLEERPRVVHVASSAPVIWDLVDRFSRLNRLLRVTAHVMRAVTLFRRSSTSSTLPEVLSPDQLKTALKFWVRATQIAYFHAERRLLQKGESVSRSSCLAKLTLMRMEFCASAGGFDMLISIMTASTR